jgi:hypothetical protein
VGAESLQQVVAKAANSVIEQKGFAGKRVCLCANYVHSLGSFGWKSAFGQPLDV